MLYRKRKFVIRLLSNIFIFIIFIYSVILITFIKFTLRGYSIYCPFFVAVIVVGSVWFWFYRKSFDDKSNLFLLIHFTLFSSFVYWEWLNDENFFPFSQSSNSQITFHVIFFIYVTYFKLFVYKSFLQLTCSYVSSFSVNFFIINLQSFSTSIVWSFINFSI